MWRVRNETVWQYIVKLFSPSYCKYFRSLWSISHIDGLVQDCSNSSALAMELLQSGIKASIWYAHSIIVIDIVADIVTVLNSLTIELFSIVYFQTLYSKRHLKQFLSNCSLVYTKKPDWWVITDSGNGLVPSDNKHACEQYNRKHIIKPQYKR